MANQLGSNSNFTPQGAQEVSIRNAGPQLGKTVPVGVARQASGAPLPAPGSQQVQAQISPANQPRGAQPVALAGQQQTAPLPQRGGGYFGPRSPQQQPASRESQQEVHVISVKGLGSDGREYIAEFDAVFPPGTRILGVTERLGA